MGTPKQLLPFGGRTVLRCVVENLLAAQVGPVAVVLGHRAGEVAACLEGLPVTVVVNDGYRAGMLSSVQAGVQAVREWGRYGEHGKYGKPGIPTLPTLAILSHRAPGGFLFCLGDQPQVGPEVIRHVVDAFCASERGIALPVSGGRRGHPAVYAAAYAAEIQALDPGVGLRELVRRHPEDVLEVPVESGAVLEDLDTPEEYARAAARVVSG